MSKYPNESKKRVLLFEYLKSEENSIETNDISLLLSALVFSHKIFPLDYPAHPVIFSVCIQVDMNF